MLIGSLIARTPRQIYITSPGYIGGAGMFHNFNIVLGCLELYDQHEEMALIVDFGKHGLYYDPQHGENWWSYYFEQATYPLRGEYQHKKAILKKLRDEEKAEIGNAAHFFMTREKAYDLIRKYIVIRKEIEQEVEGFYQEHLQGYHIIGVHYRGSDKWAEADKVAYEEVIANIDKVMMARKKRRYKIFLATDERRFLEIMAQRYGERLCYTVSHRFDGEPIHYSGLEGYAKGKEALIDCLLLAKSHVLIRTNSNLSAVAAYFNPQMEVINLNTVNDVLYQGLQGKGVLNELNRKY